MKYGDDERGKIHGWSNGIDNNDNADVAILKLGTMAV
jgi:hypothetical protein